MKTIAQGFGITTGVLLAIITLILLGICAVCVCCVALVAMSDPATFDALELSTPRPTARPIGPTPTPIAYSFSGSGDSVLNFTAAAPGAARYTASHRGEGNFAIKLLSADGQLVDLLVNDIGPYSGQGVTRLNTPGNYLLEITADGDWLIELALSQ